MSQIPQRMSVAEQLRNQQAQDFGELLYRQLKNAPWLLASIVAYSGADYDTAILYLRNPVTVTLLLLTIVALPTAQEVRERFVRALVLVWPVPDECERGPPIVLPQFRARCIA